MLVRTSFYLVSALLVMSCSTASVSSPLPEKNVRNIKASFTLHPPFSAGKRILVSQGFLGDKTHKGPLNRYAIDLVMREGESVCAAREGVVHDLNDGSGWRFLVVRESNFVRIKHEDGTIAEYQHLQPGSVKTKIGQAVKQGECFAKAGNTGKSTGPHLHFGLLMEVERELLSVPFQFVHPKGGTYTPKYLGWVIN